MPQQRIPDPYATLGLRREASSSQIRAAYRRLAKRYHPDLHTDAQATEQMRRVNQAWEILSSPSRRAEYDASRATPAASPTSHWGGAPRRARPMESAPPPWATYGSGSVHAGGRPYGRQRAAAGIYADTGSDGSLGGLRWAALLLFIPVAVLSTAILSAGLLPFPLLGFLVLIIAGRLAGRYG